MRKINHIIKMDKEIENLNEDIKKAEA